MPRLFANSVRGYQSKEYWGSEADSKNVMTTRSGLVINTIPVKRTSSDNNMQANNNEADAKKSNDSMSFLPFVTRFHMIRDKTTCDVTTDNTWSDKDIHQFERDRQSLFKPRPKRKLVDYVSSAKAKETTKDDESTESSENKSIDNSITNDHDYDISSSSRSKMTKIDKETTKEETNEEVFEVDIISITDIDNILKEADDLKDELHTSESSSPSLTIVSNPEDVSQESDLEEAAQILVDMANGSQEKRKEEPTTPLKVANTLFTPKKSPRIINFQSPSASSIASTSSMSPDLGILASIVGDSPGSSPMKEPDAATIEAFSQTILINLGINAVGQPIFKCSVCDRVFITAQAFTTHAANHYKSKNECTVCGKKFSRSWLLKGHLRTHTGEKPYKCTFPGCERAFADRSNLRSHSMIHLSADSKPGHRCTKCNRTFAQKRYLHKHMQEVCRIPIPDSPARK